MDESKKPSYYFEKLRFILPEIKRKFAVESLEVFGSYARAEAQISSDIDILVTFTEIPGLFTFIKLENYLSDRLGVKVDLVMKEALKPGLKERIIKEAILV